MEPKKRFFASLCTLQAVLFVFVMGLAFWVPIYTDEIGWKNLLARYFLDGGAMTAFPQCKSTIFTQPPQWSLPIYWVQSFLYPDLSAYFKLRVLGWFSFVAWIIFVWRFVTRLPHLRSISSKRIFAFILCFFGMGVLPFEMVVSRPDQTILWGITLLAFLPLAMKQEKSKPWTNARMTFVHLIFWVTLFSTHPKIFTFLPLLLVSFFLSVSSWRWRIPALIGLAFMSIQTHQFWGVRISCPEVPALQALLDSQSLKPSVLLSDPLSFIQLAVKNVVHVNQYLHDLDLGDEYSLNWLPPTKGSYLIYYKVLKYLLRILEIIALVLVCRWYFLLSRLPRSRETTRRLWVVGALSFSLLAYSGIQNIKNFYEIAIFFPIFGLIFILGFRKEDLKKYPKRFYALGVFFFCFGIVSLSTLISVFLPQARGPLSRGGYLDNQTSSFSAFHLDEQKKLILEAARLCAIPEKPKHLVVDDLTFSAYANSYRPFNIINLTGGWSVGLENLPQLLADYQSDGLVAKCTVLPLALRSQAIQKGEFCCIGPFRGKKL